MNVPYEKNILARVKRAEARLETLKACKERLDAIIDSDPSPMGKRLQELAMDIARIDRKLYKTGIFLQHLLSRVTEQSTRNEIFGDRISQQHGSQLERDRKHSDPL